MRSQSALVLRPEGTALPLSGPRASLTEVELTLIEGRLEQWIGFGRIAATRVLNRSASIAAFRPGATFAFVRWTSSDYGTAHSSIAIVTAATAGQPYAMLPYIRPGGDILLHVDGLSQVQLVLDAIDAVDAASIDPCDVAPDHWRHVADRLAAGSPFRPYTADRHAAWLRRRAVEA